MPSIIKHTILLLISATLSFASIGKISALNGDVSITRDSKVVKAVAGTTLEQKDIVKSSKGSTAQIVFNDNTVITVGSATTFKVEEYLFDEKTPNAKFKVEEGSFKTITGKIGKIAPDKFKLETKTATIGIRGTVFVGKIDGEGNLKIACTKGAIVVTPNLPNIPNTPPPPPTLVPEGQMTNADKKGVEPPRTYTPGDLKDLGGDLGGYAKRGGSNNQGNGNQDNKDKPTFAANDVKEKVGDSTNQIINTIVNNQTSGGSAWAAAYGEDYVPGATYNTGGHYLGIGRLSSGEIDKYYHNNLVANFDIKNNTAVFGNGVLGDYSPFFGEVSQTTMSINGQNSISVIQTGTSDGNTSTFKIETLKDSMGADYVSWGYWSRTYSNGYTYDGTWIAGAQTTVADIAALQGKTAKYSGSVLGNVLTSNDGIYSSANIITNDGVNSAKFTIDFGATHALIGNIKFNTSNGQQWNIDVGGGGSGNSFVAGVTSGVMNGNDATGSLTGKLYGPNAESMGGAFKFDSGSSSAFGVFKAKQQSIAPTTTPVLPGIGGNVVGGS